MSPLCVIYRTHGNDGYCSCARSRQHGYNIHEVNEKFVKLTLGSMIFRYLTWMPEVVKYGISNFTPMGRLALLLPPTPPIEPPKPPIYEISIRSDHKSVVEGCELTHHTTTSLLITSHAGKTELCSHQELFTPAKLLDLPYNTAGLGSVVDRTDVRPETRCICVIGYRDRDFDVVRCAPPFELCFRLQQRISLPRPHFTKQHSPP